MQGFGRSFFALKNVLGVNKKIADPEYDMMKKRLLDMSAEFKKAIVTIESLPKTVVLVSTQHLTILNSLHLCVQMSNNTPDTLNQITTLIDPFNKMQAEATKYMNDVHNLVLTPLKTYGEQFNQLVKRCQVAEKRKEDFDYANEKLMDITKRPINKQKGLADAQTLYTTAKENYDWLKLELIEDTDKLCKNCEVVALPVVKQLLDHYSQYLSELNTTWNAIPELTKKIEHSDISVEYVIKAFADSMEKDTNVLNKRNSLYPHIEPSQQTQQVEGIQYTQKIENEQVVPPQQIYQIPTQSETTTQQQTHALPPLPVQKKENEKFCKVNYDYEAQEANELSIKTDDTVKVLSSSGDWWVGELNGKTGQFPSNYVTLL
ncbi:hypothetical protein EIN_097690 [Entamoeba invadens IP1]|uniref:SH3 domain-containing protein n=1 Tax=Entamoeba invadens IP1 TaxID=370355 RepID=A0A0A1U0S9_ENTIV|nr:hypothetical protein EIN_097690 [Entamoeba invadens IP1]ELP87482.1 hypothetical protein EIN_097690 [Entamoeba invadens IP1]|eukprot:XP_004254253.1 hypothetical protein EIN_097690 [Entamoeba invadens IP1]